MHRFLVGFVLVCGCAAAATAQEKSARLAALFEEAWNWELDEDPLWATRVGDHRANDRLPRERLEDAARRSEKRREFLTRLEQIGQDGLSRADRINYEMFRQQSANELAEYEYRTHLMPITNREGFHIEFPELWRRMPLRTARDHENYIARLAAFRQYVSDHIELMRAGVRAEMTLPAVTLEGAEEPIRAHLVQDPTTSLFNQPLREFPGSVAAAEHERLRSAGRKAIEESIVPGYRDFLAFMQQEYLPAARSTIGASALPKGHEFYRHRVKRFTTLDLAPEEVHQQGLAEVQRIRQEMEQAIRESGFKGNFAAFVEHLRTDARFYAASREELLKNVALVLKRMDGQLPKLFGTLPRTPYGIREVPEYIAPRTTTAYYMPPAGGGREAGFYYVNTYDLQSRLLYEVEALSLHEAVPGHHLQIALQQELTGLPQFRRFAGATAFVEGWGLYAERLGLEVGFYEDPYSNFGRLSYEMWRACRLVVDTGMRYFGWTREQAIQFMADNTALALHNIRAEVDRYIAWPGQALAYKTGELKIRQLRKQAEEKLGRRCHLALERIPAGRVVGGEEHITALTARATSARVGTTRRRRATAQAADINVEHSCRNGWASGCSGASLLSGFQSPNHSDSFRYITDPHTRHTWRVTVCNESNECNETAQLQLKKTVKAIHENAA